MNTKHLILTLLIGFTALNAQSLEEIAKTKITTLETLIEQAQDKGIDTQREEMTVRTAEVFLNFANWDEQNKAINTTYFKKAQRYKKDAAEWAEKLPEFERSEIILMLDEATTRLSQLNNGTITRKVSPRIDWSKVTHDGDHLSFDGRPVFLADYSWKPETPELQEFFGQQDGFFLTPPFVTKADGTINPRIIKELENKKDGTIGFIFMNHKNSPQWASDKFGEGFKMREDTYTAYDIDNPGAREMYGTLLDKTVPYMAGKKYSELGYMLCNEPHFYTTTKAEKLDWASGGVSNYTIVKFQTWLEAKHGNVKTLNQYWGTNFKKFSKVSIEIPIDIALQGTPMWYDWLSFNQDRVSEWYTFLKSKVQEHDPTAKVHLKIMPNLWSDNKRGHGIDLENLTKLSGIIGNDAGSENNHMWGKEEEWEQRYSYNWREMCMGYDFMKSVSPEKIIYNTELHFLSTVKSRDLYQKPTYVRNTFWLAHTHGMNASQTWFWPRNADGSVSKKAGKGYAGSNCQQPRVINEVHATMMDLNSYSEEITAMQQQRKPLRVFYSKTSAITKPKHMDDVFELYESLFFEGMPIGFATKDILNQQDNSLWNAVIISKTEYVTQAELESLQNYLNNGGTVIMDKVSLTKNEYGQALQALNEGKGSLIVLNTTEEVTNHALAFANEKRLLPKLVLEEKNEIGAKGVTWKVVKNKAGNNVISIVNLGKTAATITITKRYTKDKISCTDLLTGLHLDNTKTLAPDEVLFVEVN